MHYHNITVADALLTEPEDYTNVAKALWESLKEETGDAPLILMGHGTEHAADNSNFPLRGKRVVSLLAGERIREGYLFFEKRYPSLAPSQRKFTL